MSNKLYFLDSYKTNFSSEILSLGSDETGTFAILKDSYFYPESGGQPSDTGLINDAQVVFVKDAGEDILHYYTGDLSLGSAECKINWEKRFDFTQQHTGQHILSAVFYDLLKGETSSFTIGEKNSTIEISISSFDEQQALEVMKLSNAVIMKNQAVHVAIYNADELDALPLRKRPSVHENIRVVSIDGFDYSPCGGTHCKNTSEVGSIRISGWEKLKNSYKIYFVCGNRNIEDCLNSDLLLKKSAAMLSITPGELPVFLERLQKDLKDSTKEMDALRKKISALEAKSLFTRISAETGDPFPCVFLGYADKSFEELRLLGQELAKLGSPLTVLYLDDPLLSDDDQVKIVLNVSESNNENVGKLGKALFEKHGGRGGGGPKAAQGNILRKQLPEFLADTANLE